MPMFNLKTMNKLAIFDLDNTLLNGDSDRNWGLFLAEKNIVDDNYLRESEKFYDNYYQGSLDIDGFLSFCLKPLVSNSMELLVNLRMEYIETKIKPILLSKGKNEKISYIINHNRNYNRKHNQWTGSFP